MSPRRCSGSRGSSFRSVGLAFASTLVTPFRAGYYPPISAERLGEQFGPHARERPAATAVFHRDGGPEAGRAGVGPNGISEPDAGALKFHDHLEKGTAAHSLPVCRFCKPVVTNP
jgi:hypothetical protein